MPVWKKKKREKLWEMSKVCFVCQRIIKDFKEASIEHIVPKSLGGTNKSRNLTLSHKVCNQLRGAIICRIVWEQKLKQKAPKMQKGRRYVLEIPSIEAAWLEKMSQRHEAFGS